jgi:NtrC-family two-component system response regulator AlgB
LRGREPEVDAAASNSEVVDLVSNGGDLDVGLNEARTAAMSGLEILNAINEKHPDLVVFLTSARGTVDYGSAATKSRSDEYDVAPASMEEAQHTGNGSLEIERPRSSGDTLSEALFEKPLLESRSPLLRDLLKRARRAASSEAIIFLTGESGVGKNVLARQIHEWSPRRRFPFVTVNCSTLYENVLETELFSHSKESFAGPIKAKPPRLETAHGGTVFLDEIAELPLSLQTKFLRFLDDERFERGGGNRTARVDTRIIVATNRDLPREIAAGQFRSDLYCHLNVISLRVPALREHMEDLLPLAERFLAEAATRYRRSGLNLSEDAKKALTAQSWPGNIRQLRNVIERAVVLSQGNLIRSEDLPEAPVGEVVKTNSDLKFCASLEQVEAEHITHVLAQIDSKEDAAAMLGIGVATLWRKGKRYHIE